MNLTTYAELNLLHAQPLYEALEFYVIIIYFMQVLFHVLIKGIVLFQIRSVKIY